MGVLFDIETPAVASSLVGVLSEATAGTTVIGQVALYALGGERADV